MNLVRSPDFSNPAYADVVSRLGLHCKKYEGRPLIEGLLETLHEFSPENPSEDSKKGTMQQMLGYYLIQASLTNLGLENQQLREQVERLESDMKKLCTVIDVLCQSPAV